MASGQDLDLKEPHCMFSPSARLLERHARIVIPCYCHDRHVQHGRCCWRTITCNGPIIATDHRKDQAHHPVIVENIRVSSTKPSKAGNDTVIVVRTRTPVTVMRRSAAPRRKQCERCASIFSLKATRHLECHHRTHAVTEECERLRFPRDQRLTYFIGEPANVLDQRLVTAVLPPWILNSQHRDIRFERLCQRMEIPR